MPGGLRLGFTHEAKAPYVLAVRVATDETDAHQNAALLKKLKSEEKEKDEQKGGVTNGTATTAASSGTESASVLNLHR